MQNFLIVKQFALNIMYINSIQTLVNLQDGAILDILMRVMKV